MYMQFIKCKLIHTLSTALLLAFHEYLKQHSQQSHQLRQAELIYTLGHYTWTGCAYLQCVTLRYVTAVQRSNYSANSDLCLGACTHARTLRLEALVGPRKLLVTMTLGNIYGNK